MNDELIINWQLVIYWHDELIIFWHANKWMSDSAHHLLAQVHLVYINESPKSRPGENPVLAQCVLCVCVCARARACVRARACACVRVRARVCALSVSLRVRL